MVATVRTRDAFHAAHLPSTVETNGETFSTVFFNTSTIFSFDEADFLRVTGTPEKGGFSFGN